jgi:hypothetical protein
MGKSWQDAKGRTLSELPERPAKAGSSFAEVVASGAHDEASAVEASMINQLKRHEIQVLLKAGHTQPEVGRIAKVSLRTVQRVGIEPEVETVEDDKERARRRIGRPSSAAPFKALVEKLLKDEPAVLSVEVLRRARLEGYAGGKSALFQLVAGLRPHVVRLLMRFEGLPGEFSQHDFGQVRVRFIDGSSRIVHFFASRLKWTRCGEPGWCALMLRGEQLPFGGELRKRSGEVVDLACKLQAIYSIEAV